MRGRMLLGCAMAAWLLSQGAPCAAQPVRELGLDLRRDLSLSGGLLALNLVAALAWPAPSEPRWTRVSDFDLRAASALGVPLVAPRDHGDALTALHPPPGLEAPAIVKALKSEFGATVAGGQGPLKGKIFRVAHLGYYDAIDLLGLLGALEVTLRRLGHAFSAGCGVAAAQAAYLARAGERG